MHSKQLKLFLFFFLFVNYDKAFGRETDNLTFRSGKSESEEIRRFSIPAIKKIETRPTARVKILEAGNFGIRPAPLLRTSSSGASLALKRDMYDTSNPQSEENDFVVIVKSGSNGYYGSNKPQPTYVTQKPIGPPITGGGGYGYTMNPYKPSPIFTTEPPTTIDPLPPSPIFTTEPPTATIIPLPPAPEEVGTTTPSIIGPSSTGAPVTSGTIVPIIGGGGGGGGGGGELPPSPPEGTILPPSPPNQGVRSNNFNSRSLQASRSRPTVSKLGGGREKSPSSPEENDVSSPSPNQGVRSNSRSLQGSRINPTASKQEDDSEEELLSSSPEENDSSSPSPNQRVRSNSRSPQASMSRPTVSRQENDKEELPSSFPGENDVQSPSPNHDVGSNSRSRQASRNRPKVSKQEKDREELPSSSPRENDLLSPSPNQGVRSNSRSLQTSRNRPTISKQGSAREEFPATSSEDTDSSPSPPNQGVRSISRSLQAPTNHPVFSKQRVGGGQELPLSTPEKNTTSPFPNQGVRSNSFSSPSLQNSRKNPTVTNTKQAVGEAEEEFPDSSSEETDSPQSSPNQGVISNSFSSRSLQTSRSRPSVSIQGRLQNSNINTKLKMRDKLRDLNLNPNVRVEPETDANIITDFVFSDIKCFKTRAKEYFGATIHLKNGFQLPYIRDRPQDPLTAKNCRMEKLESSENAFHLTVSDLKGCGVEPCGESMCLTMVFPRVALLALADDEVTTIKCIPQKNTMTETKSISFAGDSLENRRSSSTVEGGYQEFAAEVGVFRQNPGTSNGLYVKRVNSGGVVQLGEPLQLRSVVRGGDGWTHSKLTDVKVWRMRDNYNHNVDSLDPSDASEVITLVDGQGCRNNEYTVIADAHPLRDPRNELVHHFTFKAFLFRGQRANEPLIVTAKVQACQERIDCIPNDCVASTRDAPTRYKRSPTPKEINNSSAIIHDWSSKMALRVVGMKDHPSSITEEDFPFDYPTNVSQTSLEPQNLLNCAEKMAISGFGGALISLLLSGLVFGLYSFVMRGRSSTISKQRNFQSPFTVALSPHQSSGNVQHDANNNGSIDGHNNIRRTQSFHPDIIRKAEGKPPLPLPNSNDASDRRNKTDLSNVAKLLHQLTNSTSENKSEPSEYEVIGDDAGDNTSTSSSETTSNKKGDGVYIVYCCNKDKKKRPTSAPPSLRGKKNRSGSRGQGRDEASFDSNESFEESDDPYGKSGNRRTVRSVKRGNRHRSGGPALRRRLSAFYRENVKNPSISKGCSFPARYKKPSLRHVTFGRGNQDRPSLDYSDGVYSSAQMSSDIDSAYYGSVISGSGSTKIDDDSSTSCFNDVPRGTHQNYRNSSYNQFRKPPQAGNSNCNNFPFQLQQGNSTIPRGVNVSSQQQQITPQKTCLFGNGGDSSSSSMPPIGQTTATHFVTRNDSSTQIIIVPETHV